VKTCKIKNSKGDIHLGAEFKRFCKEHSVASYNLEVDKDGKIDMTFYDENGKYLGRKFKTSSMVFIK
jgi:hypothetical protein